MTDAGSRTAATMLRLIYLYRNLTRNPLRTLLTCAAVALPIMIFVLSMAVVDGVERFLDNSAKQFRLAVTHKSSIVNPLPAGYRAKIESLDPDPTRPNIADRSAACTGSAARSSATRGRCPRWRPMSDTFVATFPDTT